MKELKRQSRWKMSTPTVQTLMYFSRDELRNYAKLLGVGRGDTKMETAKKIFLSGKAKVVFHLVW